MLIYNVYKLLNMVMFFVFFFGYEVCVVVLLVVFIKIFSIDFLRFLVNLRCIGRKFVIKFEFFCKRLGGILLFDVCIFVFVCRYDCSKMDVGDYIIEVFSCVEGVVFIS